MIPHTLTDESDNERPEPADQAPQCQPQLLALFDLLRDVISCIKDHHGTYRAVNHAFVRRTGRQSKRDVIGRTASDLFAAPLAERYAEQDARVLSTGQTLRDEIELIRREDGQLGWYGLSQNFYIHPAYRRLSAITGLNPKNQ